MINNYYGFDGMVFRNCGQMSAMKTVYVIDDEFEVLLSLSRWFISKGCYVRTFSKSKPLFDALYETLPDVIVMDMQLQKEDGPELCRQIKMQFLSRVQVVMFSASSNLIKETKDSYADYVIQQSSIREQIMPILLPSYADVNNN